MSLIKDLFLGGAESRAAAAAGRGIDRAIGEQRGAYQDVEDIYAPYAGFEGAIQPLLGLAGLGGPEQYEEQLNIIRAGPEYQALVDVGEEGILQTAAATGGLRGGNTIRDIADFRRSALSEAIRQRFGHLTGLTDRGLGVAGARTGARLGTAGNIANLFTEQGATEAGGILSKYGALKDTILGGARLATGGGGF
jgi:hypothetical protein